MKTRELSYFLSELDYHSLPENAINTAKMCVEDLLGVALAGSAKPVGGIWRQYFSGKPQREDAHIWDGTMSKALCENAAALNAAYAHLMDMDDVHNTSITHLGAVTIPTAIAVAEKYHRSGKDLILAIAAGYEIGARVGEAINPESYHYWHTTAVVGGFSSAVAAGKLMGLDKNQLLNAIGSAGTQAAGIWQFLEDGAMSKTLHVANAALCGIRSAELSALGFTAAQDVLTGGRGFLGAMTPHNHPEALTRDLGCGPLKIETNSFKPYACCRHIHSAIYSAELLKRQNLIDFSKIRRITDRTYRIAKLHVDDTDPATPYGFKFSAQYCIAQALLRGDLSDDAFTTVRVTDADVRQLMQKISVVVDPELDQLNAADSNQWPHRIEIEMEDKSVIKHQVNYPFGDFNNPFSWDDMDRKFYTLTRGILPEETAAQITHRIADLENIPDVGELFRPSDQR